MSSSGPCPPVTRIALVDDHAVVRMGYRRLLEMEPELRIVAEYGSVDAAEQALLVERRETVDVLLLDLSMPGRSGLDLLRLLAERAPRVKVIVVTMHDTPALLTQCARAGAVGFVSKSGDPAVLVSTVQRAARGETSLPPEATATLRSHTHAAPHEQLTARESEVLTHLLTGAGLEEIARRMQLSEKTVSNYQTLIRQKLDVANSVELVRYARAHGLMP